MTEKNKNELMMIQNELLGDIKNVEQRMNEKLKTLTQSLEDQKAVLEKKINILEKAYNSLIQRSELREDSSDLIKEKEIMKQISQVNKKVEENSVRLELKINGLEENLKETIYRYDRSIAENFIIPGLIGSKAPFHNLRELIETTYKKSVESLKSKQQQGIDLKKYKEKLDSLLNNNKTELLNLEVKINSNITSKIENFDQRFKKGFSVIEDRINTMRLDNGKYTFNLNGKYEEVKDNCNKNIEELKNKFNELSKEFPNYRSTFKMMKEKFNNITEDYNAFKGELKSINARFEENKTLINKNKLNLENTIKDLEKSIITSTKKTINEYFEKNANTEVSKQNNFTAYVEEDEKNSNTMKKLDLKRNSYLRSSVNQISEEREEKEENTKINSLLFDGDFFGDSYNNEYLNETDRIKKARMPQYRITSGKILKHFPFITHDLSSSDRDKRDVLRLNPNYIKKKKVEKEINFPYNNHKYKYLEKKIDILGRVMVNSFNKIILQINYLKKNNLTSNNEQSQILNQKEKENEKDDNDDSSNIIIRSIKNNNNNSPLYRKKERYSEFRNSENFSSNKKVNLTKSKLNQKMKMVLSRENSLKKSYK